MWLQQAFFRTCLLREKKHFLLARVPTLSRVSSADRQRFLEWRVARKPSAETRSFSLFHHDRVQSGGSTHQLKTYLNSSKKGFQQHPYTQVHIALSSKKTARSWTMLSSLETQGSRNRPTSGVQESYGNDKARLKATQTAAHARPEKHGVETSSADFVAFNSLLVR